MAEMAGMSGMGDTGLRRHNRATDTVRGIGVIQQKVTTGHPDAGTEVKGIKMVVTKDTTTAITKDITRIDKKRDAPFQTNGASLLITFRTIILPCF
jgi:hypothetical protein